MNLKLLHQLQEEKIIDGVTIAEIKKEKSQRLFSIHWQLKTLLYLGISLFTAGLGIYIYQNIDSIGHFTIATAIGLISAGCLLYSLRNIPAFSREKTLSPGIWQDYMLLLGCLTFLIFEGYLQWQFNIFGERYGLATIIPAIALLLLAYRYDHMGILTMGITLFSSWVGISLAPNDFFSKNDLGGEEFIHSGIILGGLFAFLTWCHSFYHFKKHFTFTYANFATHLACLATLSAIITFERWFLWIPLFGITVGLLIRYALLTQSFYLVLCGVLYAYIGFSYLFMAKVVMYISDLSALYLALIYFIASAVGTIALLKKFKRNLHSL